MSDQTESSLELESEKPDMSESLVRTSSTELTWLMRDVLCVLSASHWVGMKSGMEQNAGTFCD